MSVVSKIVARGKLLRNVALVAVLVPAGLAACSPPPPPPPAPTYVAPAPAPAPVPRARG